MLKVLLWLIGILVFAGAAAYGVSIVRRKVSSLSRALFGTTNLVEGIKQRELEVSQTPKSISGAESIYGPMVSRDFPELNLQELKSMAEESIIKVFSAVEAKDTEAFNDTPKVNEWVKSKIADNHMDIGYDQLKFHNTVLNRYLKDRNAATLRFQSSFEYICRKQGNSSKVQDRLETEFVYTLNQETLKGNSNASLNCRNCGAPVMNLGDKVCQYCGSGIVQLVQKVWVLNNIRQL